MASYCSYVIQASTANLQCVVLRVELCSSSGSLLKGFGLEECEGAPHEFRGVKRSTLLEALQRVVPSECIQYGAAIHSVETDQNGQLSLLAMHAWLWIPLLRPVW